jgi:hypothetical protein
LLRIEAVSGVFVDGGAHFARRADFSFFVEPQISDAAASDSLGNLAPERQRS